MRLLNNGLIPMHIYILFIYKVYTIRRAQNIAVSISGHFRQDFNNIIHYDGPILCGAGDWRWQESHQRPEYTNWAAGEPNNFANEDCAHISSKQWYDAECNNEDNFLHGIHALCQIQK